VRRPISELLALAVLVVTGLLGLVNGFTELPGAVEGLHRAVAGAMLAYGVFGLVAALGLLARRRWSVWAAVVWGIAASFVAATAPLVFSEVPVSPRATIPGGIVTAMLASVVVVVAWRATDRRQAI
jgi:uncharacterized membrane protein (DUF2068 family)